MKSPLSLISELGGYENLEDGDFGRLAGFSLRKTLLPHDRFKKAISLIAELHHYRQHNKVGGGILICGPSGVGKSTLLDHYRESFPKVHDQQQTLIPVLYLETPSTPSVKNMAESILQALGDPFAHRGTAEEKTVRIYRLLEACKVELLLIDEFQHFIYAHSTVEFRRVSDWLKNIINHSGLAVVLVGLPEAEMVIQSNEQLARRFSAKHVLSAFDFNEESDFREFRGILKAFEQALPLPAEEPLYEANLARRFWVASNGLLDYVRKTLEGAVQVAGSAGHQSLDLGAYAAGFRKEIWKEAENRLNPFHPESPLRPLNRPGEPFYAAYQRHAIGSPLARRFMDGKK